MNYIFTPVDSDPHVTRAAGKVTIEPLDPHLYDEDEVGLMYHVVNVDNGFETDAFLYELQPNPTTN